MLNFLLLTPSVRLLGARQSLLALSRQIDKSKFNPLVVCPNPGPLSDQLFNANIDVEFVKLYNWRKPKFFFLRPFSIARLRRIITQRKIDLIHCNEFWVNPYAVAAARGTSVPIITHMRLSITPKKIKQYKLAGADKIIVVSRAAKKWFDYSPELDSKIEVVHNGVDVEGFTENVSRTDVRRELGLSEEDVLIGHIGLFSPRKRQLIALEAAKKVIPKNPCCHFLFCGTSSSHLSEYEQSLRKLVEESRLEKNIHFMPFRIDVNKVFAALDINLLISSDEGFGRVIIEAGAFGVPSIGTKIGGIPEIIIDSQTGFLINLDDADALARRITSLSEDKSLRSNLGETMKQRVKETFSIQSHTQKIENIYQEVEGKAKGIRD